MLQGVQIDIDAYNKVVTQNTDGTINLYKPLKHVSGNGFLRLELSNRSTSDKYTFDAKDHIVAIENIKFNDYIFTYYTCEYVDDYYIVTNTIYPYKDNISFNNIPYLSSEYDGLHTKVYASNDYYNTLPYVVVNNRRYDFTLSAQGGYVTSVDGYIDTFDKLFIYDNSYYSQNDVEILNSNNITIKGSEDVLVSYSDVSFSTYNPIYCDYNDTDMIETTYVSPKVYNLYLPNTYENNDNSLYELKVVLKDLNNNTYIGNYTEDLEHQRYVFVFTNVDFNNGLTYTLEYQYYVKYNNEFIKIENKSIEMSTLTYDDVNINYDMNSNKVNVTLNNNYDVYNAKAVIKINDNYSEYYLDISNNEYSFTLLESCKLEKIIVYTYSNNQITIIIGKDIII